MVERKEKIRDILQKKGEYLILGFLLLFFFTDGLNVVFSYFKIWDVFPIGTQYCKLSSISKGSAFFILMVFFFFMNGLGSKLVWWFVISGVFSFIGIDFSDKVYVLTWFMRLIKLFFPLMVLSFIRFTNIKISGSVFKTFQGLIFFQVLIVLLAFVFDWDLFSTYGPSRFGYSGFLIAQNEATFFYIIASVFVLRKIQLRSRKKDLWLLIGIFLSSLLLGTKAVFIFYASFIIYILIVSKRNRKLWVLGGIILCILLTFFVLYFTGMIKYYMNFAIKEGWLTMISSCRDQLVKDRLFPTLQGWNWYNFLFGGVHPSTSFVEMDVIDLFLFGGLVGSIFYYVILFKKLFSFSKKNLLGWFLVCQYFVIGGLAGHVFSSGINAIYLALTCFYLHQTDPGRVNGIISPENQVCPKLNGFSRKLERKLGMF